MAGKKKRRAHKKKSKEAGPSYWMIVSVIAIFLLGGLIVKAILSTSKAPRNEGLTYHMPPKEDISLEPEVLVVASNFKCACGGCGELLLIECECTMPRGAVEEKEFIRKKLKEGLSVDQVIGLVDEVYGHRIA